MDLLVDETYIINMDKETIRLKTFDSMMNSRNSLITTNISEGSRSSVTQWKYIRMPAINGKDLHNGITTVYRKSEESLELSNHKGTLQPEGITKLKEKYVKDANWLSPGEIGCLLSHVYLWELVANDPNLNRIIVFEDDARTHTDVTTIQDLICEFYTYLRQNGVEEPDMLYLGKALDECTRYEQVWKNVYKSYHPLCLHAYLITKKGAQKLLSRAPYDAPIDMVPIYAISEKSLDVMTFHPSLYFQDIINNVSSLRDLGKALNITTECLIGQQHIHEDDLKFVGLVIVGFLATLILFLLYVFMWSK